MDQITTFFTTLQASLTTLVIPVAVISLILWFIMHSLAPIMPD